ncbi:MAG: prepilin-type N-terminal cleavage/methylation domain-containing protein [Bacteriovoracaceae bacterium]|nr:prepilin-type N-terminal cleavage/methylation domain-containing protein [Bacteriovoracaceae bacterium]
MRKLLNSSSGFSLVEIMVAAGLIGIVALGSVNLSGQLSNVKKRGENFIERNDFTGALSRYIYSGKGCSDLVGTTVGGSLSDIVFSNWSYLGSSSLETGQKIEGMEVVSLQARQDLSSTLPKIKVGADELLKTTLEVQMVLKQDKRETSHFYTVPVLSKPSGEIITCNESKDVAEICNALLGTYDATNNRCNVADSCLLKGTYKTLTCSPVPADGSSCSADYGLEENNPFTGAVSCPTGSSASQTGIVTWNHSVSCGKKCTQTITNVARWFTCLECP